MAGAESIARKAVSKLTLLSRAPRKGSSERVISNRGTLQQLTCGPWSVVHGPGMSSRVWGREYEGPLGHWSHSVSCLGFWVCENSLSCTHTWAFLCTCIILRKSKQNNPQKLSKIIRTHLVLG